MKGKALNYREASKILKDNGFELVRRNGDHAIYKRDADVVVVSDKKHFSQKTWKRECKRVGIKGDF